MFGAEQIQQVADAYWYKPGESGIDYKDIFSNITDEPHCIYEDKTTSGSGRELSYGFLINTLAPHPNLHTFVISDKPYNMAFSISRDLTIEHSILARIDGYGPNRFINENGRHVDFSGTGFMKMSFALCEALGTPAERVKFLTGPGYGTRMLDNYKKWQDKKTELMEQGHSSQEANIKAIYSMPSYIAYKNCGFGLIQPDSFEITIDQNNFGHTKGIKFMLEKG